jgi:hypothetical protein
MNEQGKIFKLQNELLVLSFSQMRSAGLLSVPNL